jgi:hypothetical protein
MVQSGPSYGAVPSDRRREAREGFSLRAVVSFPARAGARPRRWLHTGPACSRPPLSPRVPAPPSAAGGPERGRARPGTGRPVQRAQEGARAACRPHACVLLSGNRRIYGAQAPKVAATLALALAAVVCVAVTSSQMGKVELEEMEQLHARTSFSVADAILKSAHVHDKQSSIPASIAALAAQAAREKETGQLTATVELPQIPKKIAAMAAEVSPLCVVRGQPHSLPSTLLRCGLITHPFCLSSSPSACPPVCAPSPALLASPAPHCRPSTRS